MLELLYEQTTNKLKIPIRFLKILQIQLQSKARDSNFIGKGADKIAGVVNKFYNGEIKRDFPSHFINFSPASISESTISRIFQLVKKCEEEITSPEGSSSVKYETLDLLCFTAFEETLVQQLAAYSQFNTKDLYIWVKVASYGRKEIMDSINYKNSTLSEEVIENNKYSEQKDISELDYFNNFHEKAEHSLRNEGSIDFARSFNLLIYMFRYEKFREFRAFDLAFNRWEELVRQDIDINLSQIKNFSNDILNEIEFLYKEDRCRNFRRILVISENSIKPITFDLLKLFSDIEEKIKNKKIKNPGTLFNVESNQNRIFETRILCCKINQYDHVFKEINDFALFTDDEEFAIVETTLISPFESPKNHTCKIITNFEALNYRKKKFDSFWDEDTLSITEFIDKYHFKDDVGTLYNVFKTFINTNEVAKIKQTSIIIETAYLELKNISDEKRRSHYERAFELLKDFTNVSFFEDLKENIFLDAFINDFKTNIKEDPVCVGNCSTSDYLSDEHFLQLKNGITLELRKRNMSYNINEEHIFTFYMTKTRNSVTKRIKKIMSDSLKKELFILHQTMSNSKEIYICDQEDKEIYLGYIKDD